MVSLQLRFFGSIITLIFGIYVYLCGYIATKPTFGSHPSDDKINAGTELRFRSKPLFGKVVIVLIDALREDFVFGAVPSMPFLQQQIEQGRAHAFTASAKPPTVTMPRIKAITTGTVPSFLDVVFNMHTSALVEDNVIHQLKLDGRKAVFYGDDTWLKLFPEIFVRYDGTSSFFVTDYTEVDNNVTRHLDAELATQDWDAMILHYLGLDHIGHLFGPHSALIGPKLQEMDSIVEKVYSSLAEKDLRRELPSLLVLCGDHGMSDAGSHGGSTYSEIMTPLVFLSSAFQDIATANVSVKPVEQLDLAPTLSLLLGLPIPRNSLGKVIISLLKYGTPLHQLSLLQANAAQLLQLLNTTASGTKHEDVLQLYDFARFLHKNISSEFTDAAETEAVARLYEDTIRSANHRLSSSLAKYDEYAIMIAIFFFLQATLVCFVELSFEGKVLYYPLSPIGVIFWLVLCLAACCLHLWVVTSSYPTMFCEASLKSFALTASALVLFCCNNYWIIHAVTTGLSTTNLRKSLKKNVQHGNPRDTVSSAHDFNKKITANKDPQCVYDIKLPGSLPIFQPNVHNHSSLKTCITKFLVVGSVLQMLSLASSSFVEEEHQTWYFFLTTLVTLAAMAVVRCVLQCFSLNLEEESTFKCHPSPLVIDDSVQHSFQLQQDQTYMYHFQQDKAEKYNVSRAPRAQLCRQPKAVTSVPHQVLNLSSKSTANNNRFSNLNLRNPLIVTNCCFILVTVRLLRSWNQTGIKWAHLPDISDFLNQPENKVLLSVLVILSLAILTSYTLRNQTLWHTRMFTSVGFVCIYLFRCSRGELWSPWSSVITQGLFEARIVYACLSAILFSSFVNRFSVDKCITMWLLLSCLLLRPHNIPVVCLTVITEAGFSAFVFQVTHFDARLMTLAYTWLGQAAFYWQGNSNSLASVDIAAGYVGLSEHHSITFLLLTLCATYSGPVYCMMCLFKTHADSDRWKDDYRIASLVSVLLRCCCLLFYALVVFIQRFHLFIWSVFLPKLLYEVTHTLVVVVFVITVRIYLAKTRSSSYTHA